VGLPALRCAKLVAGLQAAGHCGNAGWCRQGSSACMPHGGIRGGSHESSSASPHAYPRSQLHNVPTSTIDTCGLRRGPAPLWLRLQQMIGSTPSLRSVMVYVRSNAEDTKRQEFMGVREVIGATAGLSDLLHSM
jgi:hypothetical protein